MPREFRGKIDLDIRTSTPDWPAFLADKAPEGAPNVLIILYDDTGQALWSPYGGRVNMPTLDRLAENGLTYTQWHTCALCSPTRSCFLTGRNHHQNGFASISESATGFPGYNSHIPPENAPLATVLRDAGWSTFWIGKDHNVPVDEWTMGATKKNWPLGMGFDRFYGFIGGETNQWYPDLAEDNHYIEQPYLPEEGYHLTKDLVDHALEFIRDSKQTEPDKPWFMWFCPGANHAPHHSPQEYIDKYKGKFDDGYEAYREWALARMIERGILPENTELTPINPMPEDKFSYSDAVRPWDTLSDDEKRLFARFAEVFAGFSEHTDAEIGRLIDYLESSGQLDNTLIFVCADNGTSGEGTPNGSVNESAMINGYMGTVEEGLAMIDKIGSPDTYNHMPTGWAVAFSSPYRMFKRYVYQGGISDPMIIHWPKGIKARGEIRHQYHHAVDVVPTILEACGVEMPRIVNGAEQTPLPGVSMRYSFDAAPDAPTQKVIQYYEMFGQRGLWHNGWKVVTEHGGTSGLGNFHNDRWQLFHTDEDRSEAHDLSDQYPEKIEQMKALWYAEAGKYNVLPLNDLAFVSSAVDRETYLALTFKIPVPPSGQYTYYPGTAQIPERSAANTHGVSYKVLAEVELTDPDAQGVIFAHGSRFGGHALFIKNQKLYYVYNFLGMGEETQFISNGLKPGEYIFGVEFTKEGLGEHREGLGTTKLYVNDKVVAEGPMRTLTGHFTITGEGLCIGYDSADPVSKEYSGNFAFTGGEIRQVVFDVADDAYIDVERHMQAAMARD
jgi:arylsulfatase